jgi:hypothetical protein
LYVDEWGGDRLIPLGFCTYAPTIASTNVLNGSIGCAAGLFGTGAVALPSNAKYAQICSSGSAYYRDDGVAAVASGTGGMFLGLSGTGCMFYAGNLANLSIISSGTLSILLYASGGR